MTKAPMAIFVEENLPPDRTVRKIVVKPEERIMRELAATFLRAAEDARILSTKEEKEGRLSGACYYTGVAHSMDVANWLITSLDVGKNGLAGKDLEYIKSVSAAYLAHLKAMSLVARNRILVDDAISVKPSLEDITG